MTAIALVSVLLGVFLVPALADESIQIINQGNDGGSVYQTVNINRENNIAQFNVFSGRSTSNVVLDYSQNIIAYHMPYRGICVVAHMHLSSFPSLGKFEAWIHSRKDKKKDLERLSKDYQVTNNQANVAQFTPAVQALCWNIPTYWAVEYARPVNGGVGAQGCAGAHLLFMHIGLCGGIHL